MNKDSDDEFEVCLTNAEYRRIIALEKTLEKEKQSLRNENEALKKELSAFKAQLELTEKRSEDARSFREKMLETNKKMLTLTDQVEILRKANSNIQAQNASLQTMIAELQTVVQLEKQRSSSLKVQLEAVRKETEMDVQRIKKLLERSETQKKSLIVNNKKKDRALIKPPEKTIKQHVLAVLESYSYDKNIETVKQDIKLLISLEEEYEELICVQNAELDKLRKEVAQKNSKEDSVNKSGQKIKEAEKKIAMLEQEYKLLETRFEDKEEFAHQFVQTMVGRLNKLEDFGKNEIQEIVNNEINDFIRILEKKKIKK